MSITLLALIAATSSTVSRDPAPPNGQRLVQWTVGPVRCGGTVVDPVRLVRPRPELRYGETTAKTTGLRFRIDANGRPLSIKVTNEPGDFPRSDDLAPALAASRFAAGADRTDCMVDYTSELVSFDVADPRDLMLYTLDQSSGRLPREGWDRIASADTDCRRRPHPAPLLRAYPDFNGIAAVPGDRAWSMTAYDLNRRGRPVNVRTVAGTGDASLDVASRKAVARSRFAAGERKGCLYPYWRAPERIAAPPAPAESAFGPTPHCPRGDWAQPPQLTYPPAWNRRKIEGWAVIRFDVAPWGEVGNIRVLASEPADAFGQQAVQVVRSARRAPSATGASGCIERVRFAIRPTRPAGDPAAPDAPEIY